MISVLCLDPGESTGWCYRNHDGNVYGGTLHKSLTEVANHICILRPDIVVIESFKLYPSKAQSLAWNSFYPCETIGVIKYVCDINGFKWIEQAPSVKKYFGGFKDDWHQVEQTPDYKRTEHVKDAYMHLKYFERNNEKKFQK